MLIKDGIFLKDLFAKNLLSDLRSQEIIAFNSKTKNVKEFNSQKLFNFEVHGNRDNQILKPCIKKKSKDSQQSKKTIRSFWTSFLKPQLSANLSTKNSDVYKLLLSHREFSLKDIREVADHFIKKEAEIGFHKVKEFYNELVKILARNKNPNFNKYTSRLSNWCLPILSTNLFSLPIQGEMPRDGPLQAPYPIKSAIQGPSTITIPLEYYNELQACWLKYHQNQTKAEFDSNTTKQQEVKIEEGDTRE